MKSPHDMFDRELESELRSVADSDEASRLHSLGVALSRAPQPHRSKAAHQAGRRHLVAAASTRTLSWGVSLWKVALAPMAFVVLVAGLYWASLGSVPGDLAYSVKRFGESVQMATALSDSKRAILCSGQMKTRANELARLPADRLTESTVTTLSQSILKEAQEYSDYINQAGNTPELLDQRERDAKYVLEAVLTAKARTSGSTQTAAIDEVIAAMNTIVPEV